VAVVWGSTFVIQRIAAQEGGLLVFNGVRFLVGALTIAPFAIHSFLSQPAAWIPEGMEAAGFHFRTAAGVVLAGLFLMSGSGFQQVGMQYTTAGNAGFITGLYVVVIPLLLAIVGRQPARPIVLLAAFLAAVGLFMLSTGGSIQVNRGDGLVLVGTLFWALHVILVGWIVKRIDVTRFAVGQFLVCGLASLALGLIFEPQGLQSISGLWLLVVYTGVLTIGMGFTLQAVGQRTAPPADAAIILSMETVFAALSGWIFLQEYLLPVQLAGCGIMLLGMLTAQSDVLFRKRGQSKSD
jgi:drug/metabolite transporter (DMT)-like permease